MTFSLDLRVNKALVIDDNIAVKLQNTTDYCAYLIMQLPASTKMALKRDRGNGKFSSKNNASRFNDAVASLKNNFSKDPESLCSVHIPLYYDNILVINDDIKLSAKHLEKGYSKRAMLSFDAPSDVGIDREELYKRNGNRHKIHYDIRTDSPLEPR